MGVSVTEQIKRLAEVDLNEERGKSSGQRIIPMVDRRLVTWGEWKLSERADSGEAAGSSMLGALMDSQGELIRSTNPSAGSMPDDIYDTDKAVQRLPVELERVVREQYTNLIATAAQKAETCGCSTKTFYRRLGKAHQEILFVLKPPRALRSRGLANRYKGKCAPRAVDTHDNRPVEFS